MRTSGEISEWIHEQLHKVFPEVGHIGTPQGYIVCEEAAWVFVFVIENEEPYTSYSGLIEEDFIVRINSLVAPGIDLEDAEWALEELEETYGRARLQITPNSGDEEKVNLELVAFASSALEKGGELVAMIHEMVAHTEALQQELYAS